jgi:hypothetical protein
VITTKITRIVEEPGWKQRLPVRLVLRCLFGLDGLRVLAAADAGGELELLVETIAEVVACGLPRVFRTAVFAPIYAASCEFMYSVRTSCGVR